MIKYKYSFLILLIILIFYISIVYPNKIINSLGIVKDYLLYPVKAIDSELLLSNETKDNIILELKKEISELQKISDIKMSLTDYNYINATIIERNREYWFNSLTINKGKDSGVDIDMAVIDSNGLIGRISNVTKNTSIVKLITTNDINSKISAVIELDDKKIYGIISGYNINDNLLNLIINNYEDIPNDSKVLTTGMGGVFPRGILIGKVVDVIKKEDDVTNVVLVKPISNIEGERYVSVLQRKEISNN